MILIAVCSFGETSTREGSKESGSINDTRTKDASSRKEISRNASGNLHFSIMTSWRLGNIPVPTLRSLCEDAIGFSIPNTDFLTHLNAFDIYQSNLTKKQQNEIRTTCNTSYVWVKLSEDVIIPRLSVERGGHVSINFDTWLQGKRNIRRVIPTKEIFKAHKANQVTQIKRLLDTTETSQTQIDSILKVLKG